MPGQHRHPRGKRAFPSAPSPAASLRPLRYWHCVRPGPRLSGTGLARFREPTPMRPDQPPAALVRFRSLSQAAMRGDGRPRYDAQEKKLRSPSGGGNVPPPSGRRGFKFKITRDYIIPAAVGLTPERKTAARFYHGLSDYFFHLQLFILVSSQRKTRPAAAPGGFFLSLYAVQHLDGPFFFCGV